MRTSRQITHLKFFNTSSKHIPKSQVKIWVWLSSRSNTLNSKHNQAQKSYLSIYISLIHHWQTYCQICSSQCIQYKIKAQIKAKFTGLTHTNYTTQSYLLISVISCIQYQIETHIKAKFAVIVHTIYTAQSKFTVMLHTIYKAQSYLLISVSFISCNSSSGDALCPQMLVDILGTRWDQCVSMVQYSFTSTETIRLIRTDSPGWPPRLSHSSWTMMSAVNVFKPIYTLWAPNTESGTNHFWMTSGVTCFIPRAHTYYTY